MADEIIASEFGDMFSDYNPENEQLDTLDDLNGEMFDLLGMSEEDKAAARQSLKDEDEALKSEETAEEEMTMEEKAAKEALEFIKQANAGGEDPLADVETAGETSVEEQTADGADISDEGASGEEASSEEDRLNNMLDDIFAEEEAEDMFTSEETTVDETPEVPAEEETASSDEESVADSEEAASAVEEPAIEGNAEAESEAAMDIDLNALVDEAEQSATDVASDAGSAPVEDGSDVEALQALISGNAEESEPADALSQMNSIIDNALSNSEAEPEEAPKPAADEAPEPKKEFDLSEEDVSNVNLVDYSAVDISDDLLNEIDVTEDLTKSLDEAGDLAQGEAPLTKRQLKKKQKAEAKAAKKAAKEAKKLEKAAKKLKPEEKDPNDIIVELENAFANEDIVSTMEKIADVGVEGAADEAAGEVDLNAFIEGDAANAETEEKKSFKEKLSLLLFGPPEEGDYPTEEEIEAKKAAKEAKIAAKEKAKEEKEIQKKEAAEAKAAKKNQAKEVAVVKKAAAADKKAKIAAEEEAEDALERRITPKQVITTFVILAVLAATVVLGTNEFSYHMVITRATNYFEMQKYRKAYDQIVGVDVKDRDKEIKDKIYCVMYVQQQLDSYNNFCKLEMYENALDSLVKGVRKYEEHYEEAKAMGIAADLDGLHAEIEKALKSRYGLTMEAVKGWTALDQTTYTNMILDYVSGMKLPMEKGHVREQDAVVDDPEEVVDEQKDEVVD